MNKIYKAEQIGNLPERAPTTSFKVVGPEQDLETQKLLLEIEKKSTLSPQPEENNVYCRF